MLELAIILTSIALLIAYHLRLRQVLLHFPSNTAYGRHRIARRQWLRRYAGGDHDLLMVHTLRNWIMSATFLASTAILITLGLLGVAFTNDRLSTFVHELNAFGSQDARLLLIKILILALIFLSSFFCFSLAIRSFTHAGFELNLPGKPREGGLQEHELEKGALFYFLGLRCYYLSIPFALWLFGPAWMLTAVVVLILLLLKLD